MSFYRWAYDSKIFLQLQLRCLVEQENQKCWGKPLGSQNLWIAHLETIERIQNIASQIEIQPNASTHPGFTELPEECIRKIILQMSDHKDLESAASAWSLMNYVVQEQRIWRELAKFHFDQMQINSILEKLSLEDTPERHRNWQTIYHALRKWVGLVTSWTIILILFILGDMDCARISSTRRCWLCVASALASSGPQWDTHASPKARNSARDWRRLACLKNRKRSSFHPSSSWNTSPCRSPDGFPQLPKKFSFCSREITVTYLGWFL